MTLSDRQGSIYLIRALVRALGHQIRTPLSVISNELAVYQRLLPNEEVGKLIERCRGISALLQRALVPAPTVGSRSDIVIGLQRAGALLNDTTPIELSCGEEERDWLCRAMRTLFASSGEDWKVNLSSGPLSARLACALGHPAARKMQHPEVFRSCAELFNGALDLDLLEPPLVDALLEYLKAELVIEVSQAAVVVEFPLAPCHDT